MKPGKGNGNGLGLGTIRSSPVISCLRCERSLRSRVSGLIPPLFVLLPREVAHVYRSSGHHLILDLCAVVDTASSENDRSPDHCPISDPAAGLEKNLRSHFTTLSDLHVVFDAKRFDELRPMTDALRFGLRRFRPC